MRKYKKKTECPQEVEEFIRIINVTKQWDLSQQSKLGSFDSLFQKELNKCGDTFTAEQELQTYLIVISRLLFQLNNDEFCKFITDGKTLAELQELNQGNVSNAVNRLRNFGRNKKMLEKVLPYTSFITRNRILPGKDKRKKLGKFNLEVQMEIDSNSYIHFATLDYEFLMSLGRIRVCKICSNIFWAKRIYAETCSKKCSDVLSQREYQEKNKKEFNKRRRETYYIYNAIPYCEKCVRPNTKCSCYLLDKELRNGTL